MSEIINNTEYRKQVLKELIMELHNGKSVEEVRERFAKLIEGVSPAEISEMEQNLIMEGMPVTEVQRLCDVHAAVFKGSIEEIHRVTRPEETPGHPVHTFKLENREIEKLINDTIKPNIQKFKQSVSEEDASALTDDFNNLLELDKHYSRKENLLFPYLEHYGITAPPKVMWGVDDEIRSAIKEVKNLLSNYKDNAGDIVQKAGETVDKALEMIFKEENILFPMALETLTEDQWLSIARESEEIGYCLTRPEGIWKPERADVTGGLKVQEAGSKEAIRFETGVLTPKEINAIFNNLPVDITFVDKDDVVKYFSQAKERIFARTKAVIGRHVQNCHPPASVHIVEQIVKDFKAGKKDHEDFWINMGGMVVYIRYFAVRDEKGEYMGTLEVTQNIKPIQELKGEKRLVTK